MLQSNSFPLKESKKFYGYSLDSNIRRQSSSGGLFSHIAGLDNAVVFGANLENWHEKQSAFMKRYSKSGFEKAVPKDL